MFGNYESIHTWFVIANSNIENMIVICRSALQYGLISAAVWHFVLKRPSLPSSAFLPFTVDDCTAGLSEMRKW